MCKTEHLTTSLKADTLLDDIKVLEEFKYFLSVIHQKGLCQRDARKTIIPGGGRTHNHFIESTDGNL